MIVFESSVIVTLVAVGLVTRFLPCLFEPVTSMPNEVAPAPGSVVSVPLRTTETFGLQPVPVFCGGPLAVATGTTRAAPATRSTRGLTFMVCSSGRVALLPTRRALASKRAERLDRGMRLRDGLTDGQDRGTANVPGPKPRKSLVRLLEREGLDLRSHGHLRGECEKLLGVPARQVGDRAE